MMAVDGIDSEVLPQIDVSVLTNEVMSAPDPASIAYTRSLTK